MNFIDEFVKATEGFGIPKLFRKWGAIYLISSALGRQCWNKNDKGDVFANLFVLVIAPPATGKSILDREIKTIMRKAFIRVAPQDMTKQGAKDFLEANQIKFTYKNQPYFFSQLNVVSTEFKVTFPQHDLSFLQTMADFWDAPEVVSEIKRKNVSRNEAGKITKLNEIFVENVWAGLFAGIQPAIFANEFSAEAWSAGFLTRTIFCYAEQGKGFRLRGNKKRDENTGKNVKQDELAKHLMFLKSEYIGEFTEDDSFVDAYNEWVDKDYEPKPHNLQLASYNGRREHQVEKLSLIYNAARKGNKHLTREDFENARQALEEVEATFEPFFDSLIFSEEQDILNNLINYMRMRAQGKPVAASQVVNFLHQSGLPASRIPQFIEIIVKSAKVVEIKDPAGGKIFYQLPSAE